MAPQGAEETLFVSVDNEDSEDSIIVNEENNHVADVVENDFNAGVNLNSTQQPLVEVNLEGIKF